MRTSPCTLAILAATILTVGCKKGPELAGKWNATAGGQSIDVEFKPDNTFTMGTGAIKAKGEYKLDGEKLTLTTKDIEIPGLPASVVAKAKTMPSFGQPKDVTIKFNGDDELSLTGLTPSGAGSPMPKSAGAAPASGPAVTLKRVKA